MRARESVAARTGAAVMRDSHTRAAPRGRDFTEFTNVFLKKMVAPFASAFASQPHEPVQPSAFSLPYE